MRPFFMSVSTEPMARTLLVYARNYFMHETSTNCMSTSKWDSKPGKYESTSYAPRWLNTNRCPDCDKKRISACKDPDCNKTQTK